MREKGARSSILHVNCLKLLQFFSNEFTFSNSLLASNFGSSIIKKMQKRMKRSGKTENIVRTEPNDQENTEGLSNGGPDEE